MKLTLTITFVCITAISAQNNNPDLDDQWEDFIQRYDKNYELGEAEVLLRI